MTMQDSLSHDRVQLAPFSSTVDMTVPKPSERQWATSSAQPSDIGWAHATSSKRAQPEPQQTASDAPFRLTVTDSQGAVTILLRTHKASADDLKTFEAQAQHALRRYGLRAAKLLINGIERQLTVSGDASHAD